MMINDTKNVFYSRDQLITKGDHISTNLRATNIDKKGNRYDMLLVWTSYTDEHGHELVDHAYVEIVKNGKVIKNIDLQLANPRDFYVFFIENENNWRFVVFRRTPTYYEGVFELITNAGTFILETWILDNPEYYFYGNEYGVFSIAASIETKYMLHNGYYYKMRFSRYTTSFTVTGDRGRLLNVEIKILTEHSPASAVFLLLKQFCSPVRNRAKFLQEAKKHGLHIQHEARRHH